MHIYTYIYTFYIAVQSKSLRNTSSEGLISNPVLFLFCEMLHPLEIVLQIS